MPLFQENYEATPDEQDQSPIYSDYGTAAASSVDALKAQGAAAARYIAAKSGDPAAAGIFGAQERLSNLDKEEKLNTLSPEAKKRIESSVTDGTFWTHPLSVGALKTAGMAAPLAAALVPGGVVKSVLTAAMAGGAVNAASVVDDIYNSTDKLDDKELQKQSSIYRGMRTLMPEKDARAQLQDQMLGLKPALNFAVGAAMGLVGPAGTLARGGVAGAGEGLLARTAAGAGEGFAGGAAQGAVGGVSQQVAEVEGGTRKEFDDEALVKQTLEGGIMGAVPGAVAGAVVGGHGKVKALENRVEAPEAAATTEVTTGVTPEAVKAPLPEVKTSTADTGVASTAAPAVDPSFSEQVKPAGTGANPPPPGASRPAVTYAKPKAEQAIQTSKERSKPPKVEQVATVEAIGPDPDMKAALDARGTQEAPNVAPSAPGEPLPVAATPQNETSPKVTSDVTPTEHTSSEGGTNVVSVVPRTEPVEGTPQKPRILEDKSQESKANVGEQLKAQIAAEREAKKAASKLEGKAARADQKVGERLAHDSGARAEKIAKDRANAKEVFEFHEPLAGEEHYASKDPAERKKAREHLLIRAEAAVEAAKAKGTKAPERVHKSQSNEMAWLAEANGLVRASRSKSGAKAEHFQRFFQRDKDYRAGNSEAARSERISEGEQANRRDQGNTEELPAGNHLGEVPEDASTLSPEEHLERAEESEHEPESDISGGNERKQVVFRDDKSGYTAVSKAQQAKEVSKSRDQLKALKPKVEGKISLGRRTDTEGVIPALAKSNVIGKPQEGVPRLRESEHAGATSEGNAKSGTAIVTTLGKILNLMDTDHLEGVPKAIASEVIKQFGRLAPDVAVYVKSHEDLRAWGETQGYKNGLDGVWFPGSGHPSGKPAIYLSDRAVSDKRLGTLTVLHEASHEVMANAIEKDPVIKARIKGMMDEVKAHYEADLKALVDLDYAFTNEHEFLAEAFSNPEVQNLLAKVPLSREMARELGFDRKLSMWDGFVKTVLDAVEKIIGRLPRGVDGHKMIEAVLRTGGKLMDAKRLERVNERRARMGISPMPRITDTLSDALSEGAVRTKGAITQAATHPVDSIKSILEHAETSGPNKLLHAVTNALTTNDQLRQRIGKLVPQSRKIFDTIEKQGVYANELKKAGTKLASDLVALQKKYPGAFQKWSELLNQQTMLGLDASSPLGAGRNSHLGLSAQNLAKQAKGTLQANELPMSHWEAHAAHPELSKEFKKLPKEFKGAQDKLFEFFETSQRDTAKEHISNMLRAAGVAEGDISKRADTHLAEKNTQDVRDNLDKLYGEDIAKQILGAKKLTGSEGPYSPLMRHGDHVIGGKYKLTEPTTADGLINKVNDHTFEFKTRDQAHKFALKSKLGFDVDKVYYDNQPGKASVRTTKVGGITTSGGPEERYEVKLNRRHVEFAQSKREALARHKELDESGILEGKPYVEAKQDYINKGGEIGAGSVRAIIKQLEKTDEYNRMSPAQQKDARRSIEDAALVTMAGNRVQSRRLPRRNIQGASDDTVRNLLTFNDASSNYRAKVKHRPVIEEAITEMMKHVEDSRAGSDAKEQIARSEAANEVVKRAQAQNPDDYSGSYTNLARKISTWSYVDRMLRPSHLLLHQTHLPLITVPHMAGRHGAGASYGQMLKTWKQLTGVYSAGGKDFVNSIANSLHEGTNYSDLVKRSLKGSSDLAGVSKMIDELGEIGLIHPQAGLEVSKFHDDGSSGVMGGVNKIINKFDTVFRHATNATEAINRYVGAISAYRLEYAKLKKVGLTEDKAHAGAVEYARNTIANTQGFYSSTNAAPLFKHQFLRPFLQFKQFPQMMYNLLIQTGVKAFKGDTKAERVQAAASLAAVLGAHTAMTGLLGGLPLEVLKFGGLITKGLGITNSDWNDVEQWEQEQAVKHFGKGAGNVIMHGLSSLSGADLHHRLGLNSFLTFGLPDKPDTDNMRSFLFQAATGAPGGLAEDAFKGISSMLHGDFMGGALQATPLQVLRDIQKAWNGGGSKPDAYKYKGAGETVARVLGFTPTGEADYYDRKNTLYNNKTNYNDKRNEFEKSWAAAKGNEKATLWGKIEKWNNNLPKDARLTRAELDKYATNKTKAEGSGKRYLGLSFDKKTNFIKEQDQRVH